MHGSPFAEVGDAGKPRNDSHFYPNPKILMGGSLSGKVTHKVAHNDASSQRNLKADSDHDQESFHFVIGSIACSGCTFNHAEIVPKCITEGLGHAASWQIIFQWLREFNSVCRAERVYIGLLLADSRCILIVSIALACQFREYI